MEQEIKEVMAAVLGLDPDTIDDATSATTVENWDSLNHMNLVLALEERYHVHFSNDEIMNIMSYSLILLTLKEKVSCPT